MQPDASTSGHSVERKFMLTDIPGTPCRFDELKAGDCFAFRFRDHVPIGLKLVAADKTDRVAILSPCDPETPNAAPSIIKSVPQGSMIVHKLDATIECQWGNIELRDGISNPKFGQLVVAGTQKLLCVRNTLSDDDPVFVDLSSGAHAGYSTKGPSAAFFSWSITLKRDKHKETICTFVVRAVD
jgi:hypothetical protein